MFTSICGLLKKKKSWFVGLRMYFGQGSVCLACVKPWVPCLRQHTPDVVVQTYNPSMEAEGLEVRSQLHEASLGYMETCLLGKEKR